MVGFFLKTWKTIRSFTRRTIHLKDDGISDSQEIMTPQSSDEKLQNSTSDDMWTVVLEILFSTWPFRMHLWWIKYLHDCQLGQMIYCIFIVLLSCPCCLTHVKYSGLCSSGSGHLCSSYLGTWTPMPCLWMNDADLLCISMFQILVSAEFRNQPHRDCASTSSQRKLLQISTLPCPDWAAQLMLKT